MCELLSIGTQVEIQGLKSRVDLNGKRGWVTAHVPDSDRMEVSFEGPRSEKIKVKPLNAIPVSKLQSEVDGLAVGVCVEIMGLQSRSDLNGRRGSIVSRDDVAGRIEVQLDGLSGGERVKVKPANAKIAKDGLAVGVQVEVLGLQSRSDLNGRRGVLVAREVAADFLGNDRLEVHLDGPNGGERIKCKPDNVKLISRQLDLSAAVEIAAAAARAKAKSATGSDEATAKPDDAPVQRDQRHDSHVDRDRDREHNRDRDHYRDRERPPERSRSRPRQAKNSDAPRGGGGGRARDGAHNYTLRNGTVEDRSEDWVCKCGERNFAKRAECFRCRAPRTKEAPSYKGVSHMLEKQMQAQQDMIRASRRTAPSRLREYTSAKELLGQADLDDLRRKLDSRSLRKGGKMSQRRVSSSSSSSSSESSSKSRSASPEKTLSTAATPAVPSNSELDKLKDKALQALLKIRDEPLEVRKKSWRALLLEWHPDKHPGDKENATAVFQFLQKGKALVDLKGG
eukprot:TRINITY_DN89196_c0_g1_i1.p1 TRINITY_DN89196_c0_g1~~TRINITY_DN89196_c0_g1_i1.p1  ORF type:complete len:509 (+),score=82.01 TRINITY_DN89196_c0_g1_i1:166-1692(+)